MNPSIHAHFGKFNLPFGVIFAINKRYKNVFKLTSRNAYRDLVRNARRICIADMSEAEKRSFSRAI